MLHAPEDGKYYMWAASMTNNCTLDAWMTNSEVVLAVNISEYLAIATGSSKI